MKLVVQHHYAHALSCIAEHNLEGSFIAIILDGTGYGEDGAIWGCEFMKVTPETYERLGHLRYISLPGGEKCISEPWRTAAVYLERVFGNDFEELDIPFTNNIDWSVWEFIKEAVNAGFNTFECSSAGRLFDAVSAILGIRYKINYEGQAAVELEQMLEEIDNDIYPFSIVECGKVLIIDPDPIIKSIVDDIKGHKPISIISGKFHNTMANIILCMAERIRDITGITRVILSGGVFQNIHLLDKAYSYLKENKFYVYVNHKVPPNDGGISLGQAFYAFRR